MDEKDTRSAPARESATTSSGPFSFRRQLGRPLRVGGIDYLNSRPLIETFDEVAGDEVVVENHLPSELARNLRSGSLDVALVPVVEYFTSPCWERYAVVPGIGISSYGPVESIRLFYRRPLPEVSSVALDSSSMTSGLLTRLLFAERPDDRWRCGRGEVAPPVYETVEPVRASAWLDRRPPTDGAPDAVLLIGDAALGARPVTGWSRTDLGLEWTRWTGLPFVYALWVYQGEALEGLVSCLSRVSATGYASIDRIVERGPLPAGMTGGEARRYLGQVIRFRLGEPEIRGLETFVARLRRHGLLPLDGPERLRFVEEP